MCRRICSPLAAAPKSSRLPLPRAAPQRSANTANERCVGKRTVRTGQQQKLGHPLGVCRRLTIHATGQGSAHWQTASHGRQRAQERTAPGLKKHCWDQLPCLHRRAPGRAHLVVEAGVPVVGGVVLALLVAALVEARLAEEEMAPRPQPAQAPLRQAAHLDQGSARVRQRPADRPGRGGARKERNGPSAGGQPLWKPPSADVVLGNKDAWQLNASCQQQAAPSNCRPPHLVVVEVHE